jgi:hypothetical protein
MEYDLVFEGGGAKGILFVGALQEFETRGHTVCRTANRTFRRLWMCLPLKMEAMTGSAPKKNLDLESRASAARGR